MYIPDNYDAFKHHDAEQEAAAERLPVCCECGERIESEFCYQINDEILCEDCIENYKKFTSDLME